MKTLALLALLLVGCGEIYGQTKADSARDGVYRWKARAKPDSSGWERDTTFGSMRWSTETWSGEYWMYCRKCGAKCEWKIEEYGYNRITGNPERVVEFDCPNAGLFVYGHIERYRILEDSAQVYFHWVKQ